MRIFLVEDSSMLRRRLQSMLAQIPGAEVIGTAANARDAVERILAQRPDIVVVDIRLTDGTGFEVLREVRDRAPEVDVYMLSNFASAPYRRLAAELGAADFFDKSTEFERVRDLIAQRAAQAQTV